MRLVRKHLSAILFIIALLPVILLRDFTPSNELRYLSIADEALRDGHLFAFFNHGIIYADKPPLYLWIVMAGRWLFGDGCMAFISLFSLVPALVIVTTMHRWTRSELTQEQSGTARIMLLTCGLFPVMAVTLRMDMLMVMFIVLALRRFSIMEQRDSYGWHHSILMGTFVFLAVFSKGPLGILVPLVGTLVYALTSRRWTLFFRVWNFRTWSVLIALCALWFGLAYLEGGLPYLNEMLFHQTMGRAVNAFHHKRPFYFYLIAITYTMLPWLPYFAIVAYKAIRRHTVLPSTSRYFLCIILTTFVMLSAFSSKLQVYLLPIFPFAVYLSVMTGSSVGCSIPLKVMRRCGIALLCITFTAGLALPWINPYIGYRDLCLKARDAATTTESAVTSSSVPSYYTCGLSRTENMDVFLGTVPTTTMPHDLPSANTLFILAPVSYFDSIPHSRIVALSGNNAVIIRQPSTTN